MLCYRDARVRRLRVLLHSTLQPLLGRQATSSRYDTPIQVRKVSVIAMENSMVDTLHANLAKGGGVRQCVLRMTCATYLYNQTRDCVVMKIRHDKLFPLLLVMTG